MVDLKVWLGYDHVFIVNHVNTWAGLAFFWKNSVQVNFLFYDKNLLDVNIKMCDKQFYLSCIYGNHDIKFKHTLEHV